MDDLKTLAEIWESAERKPIDVLNIWITEKTKSQVPYRLVGVDNDKAFCRFQDSQITEHDAFASTWKLHKEKKLVKYWPALMLDNSYRPPRLMIEPYLYKSNEEAEKHFKNSHATFIRLATELPPIMLETEDE